MSSTNNKRDHRGHQVNSSTVRPSASVSNEQGYGGECSFPRVTPRAPRAIQACRSCRISKTKCDEAPQCRICMTKGISCVRDPVEPRIVVTNAQADILGKLDELLSSHQQLKDTILRAVPSLVHDSDTGHSAHDSISDQQQNIGTPIVNDISSPASTRVVTSFDQQVQARSMLIDTTIPADHTTRWVGILEWPPLRQITEPLMPAFQRWPDPLEQELAEAGPSLDQSNGGVDSLNSKLGYQNTLDSGAVIAATHRVDSHIPFMDQEAILSFTQTYLLRISTMHPIISPQQLDHLVARFLPLEQDMISFLGGLRLHGVDGGRSQINYPYLTPSQSIQTTLLLLVLALGQACEGVRDGTHDASAPPGARSNLERVSLPGYVFFRAAIVMMSDDHGNWKLSLQEHVQANILAGLYQAQYSRVLESHGYYARASHLLYLALKPHRSALITMATQHERVPIALNHLVILFWSCLQLESDIIAELHVPPSAILTWESTMPWPDLEICVESGLQAETMQCYLALLWLRRRLNHVHAELYGPGVQDSYTLAKLNDRLTVAFVDSLRDSLEGSHTIAPPWVWQSSVKELTPGVLAERVRAKYYGVIVIIYRPYLRSVLDTSITQASHKIPPLVMKYAGRCVTALVQSTAVFHQVKAQKLILSNFWGTAWAQCGNVLLLLATYKNHHLRALINRALLEDLVDRTLGFVVSIAHSSPALWNMHKLLRGASAKVLSSEEYVSN